MISKIVTIKNLVLINIIRILNKCLNENSPKSIYSDLTPRDDVDEKGHYSKAIQEALRNPKVTNIAITGNYGSGKSSLLKTFQKTHSEYKFLDISLATFKKESQPDEVNQENILEKSILQQIFYRVDSKKVPNSRFKRIKKINPLKTILNSCLLIFIVTFLIQVIKPKLFANLYHNFYRSQIILHHPRQNRIILTILFFVSVLGIFWFIIKLTNYFTQNLKLSKVTLPKVTIELDKKADDSVFHKYIDEILYFFKETKYNVVIFEDLDRFNNVEIFENLRELNMLINNSEEVNRRIVFIYAIKDEIFNSEDDPFYSKNRTKFFDFIVPVIPTIDSSNSFELIKQRLLTNEFGTKVSDEILSDVTIYIDDMRVLINICNEYFIYSKVLGDINLNPDNLLAMIVYKNIYPVDFANLQENKGMVYGVFANKKYIIENAVNNLKIEIESLENKIELASMEAVTSIDELQIIYAHALGAFSTNNRNNNYYIYLDQQQFSYQHFNLKDFFDKLKKAKTSRYHLHNRGHISSASVNDIDTVFGTKKSYMDRERIVKIKEKDIIDEIKQNITQLEKKIAELYSSSLKDLIEINGEDDLFDEKIKDHKLLLYLLRNGFIDELYHQYITYFYSGSLTIQDMQFIMSVKNREDLHFDYKLAKIEKVLMRLNTDDFKRPSILNYNLFNYIIENKNDYNLFFDLIIEQLSNESNRSVQFIDNFILLDKHRPEFVRIVFKRWHNMWNFIVNNSNYSKDKVVEYLVHIIKYAENNDIVASNNETLIAKFIEKHKDFIFWFPDTTFYGKIKDVIKSLNVKFKNLEIPEIENDLVDFIYQNNLYEINELMINHILKLNTQEQDTPLCANYSTIMKSNCSNLIDYVKENINFYIENVFLKLQNTNEDEKVIVELLNDEDVNEENKTGIVNSMGQRITSIKVVNTEWWDALLSINMIVVTWKNILDYYQEFSLNNVLINYLNNEKNISELSTQDLYLNETNRELVNEFSSKVIKCKEILDECFNKIACKLTKYKSFPLQDLPAKRVESMIINSVLSPNSENFKAIKENFSELPIKMIEKNPKLFIDDWDTFQLDSLDIMLILNSRNIPSKDKLSFVKKISVEVEDDNFPLIENIAKFVVEHNIKVTQELLTTLLKGMPDLPSKLGLITRQIGSMSNDQITEVLDTLDEPYSLITQSGKRPLFENIEMNRELLEELVKINYISSLSKEKNMIRAYTLQRSRGE